MGDFDLTLGAFLMGISFNTFLFGLVCFQYLNYKSIVFKDPLWMKMVVVLLFFIDLSQSVVGVYGLWYFAVENFGNPNALMGVLWVTPFCAAGTSLSALIVQLFLVHRLYRLTHQMILAIIISAAALAACVCGVIAGVKSGIIGDAKKLDVLIPLCILWLSLEAAVDIVNTIGLTIVFKRSKTGLRRTDTMLNRLIRGAIQTGLFSSICAILNLIVFVRYNHTSLYALFNWPLGRIYANTLLDTLTSRKPLIAVSRETEPDGYSTGLFSTVIPFYYASSSDTTAC